MEPNPFIEDIQILFTNWWTNYWDLSTVNSTYRTITNVILSIFSILLFYRFIYILLGFFGKSATYKEAPEDKTYAVVISARNEEQVIGNLIKSLQQQTYDNSKIKIFVVADNCDDNTALICRNLGAVVYERFNTEQISKGYALEFLFEHIERDYGISSFDYYLVFDADNLVDHDFIREMNKAFYSGYDIVTSFRNIKNFDTNLITASYGIHFYRNALINHRPRSIIHSSTNLTGTGYGFKSEIIKDGWHYTSLTEDTEFTILAIANNYKIGYCEKAQIFDEQPVDFKTSWKQRLRWRRGVLLNYIHCSYKLIGHLFTKWKWCSYDIFWHLFPYDLLSFFLALFAQLFGLFFLLATTGDYDILIFIKYVGGFILGTYINSVFIGLLVLIKERKRIQCNFFKKVFYLLFWPWFDLLSILISIQAMFYNVKWTPIKHCDQRTIDEVGHE